MLRATLLSMFSLALVAQGTQPARPARVVRPQAVRSRQEPAGIRPITPIEKPKDNKLICRIGDEEFREYDFLDYVPLVYPPDNLEQILKRPEMRKQAEKSFMETMLLVHLAKKEGVDQTPEFHSKMAALTKLALYQEALMKKAPELEELAKPTDEQMLAYYEEHAANYRTEERASARHILVTTRTNEGDASKPSDEEALAKMALIKSELAKGKSWEDAAKEYSDDAGSKEKGGLYENFNPAQMVPPFAEAVRSQEIGAVGEPVKTQYGYHLILVENFTPSAQMTFDDAKGAIQRQLSNQRRTEVWTALIDSLKTEFGFSEPPPADPEEKTDAAETQ